MKNLFTRTMLILVACAIVIVGVAVSAQYAEAKPKLSPLPASEAISNHRGFNLLNSTNTVIADLFIHNSSDSNHQITTSFGGRILVSAQINIENPAGVPVRGACELLISDGTGPNNGLTSMGRSAVWYTNDNPAYDLAVPVLGYATKPAGTYNVVVLCQQLGAVGGTVAILDNMIVWEAAE